MGLFKNAEESTKKKEAELLNLELDDKIARVKAKKERREQAAKQKPADPDMARLIA